MINITARVDVTIFEAYALCNFWVNEQKEIRKSIDTATAENRGNWLDLLISANTQQRFWAQVVLKCNEANDAGRFNVDIEKSLRIN